MQQRVESHVADPERTFRLSPEHHVVLFDRLSRAERERLAPLRRDPSFYGVIRSDGGARETTMIAASRDVALLLLTLREPGRLPSYVVDAADPEIDRTIAQLVLDGVLEVEAAGGFVSGAAALRGFSGASSARGHIATISREALVYASMLDTESPLDVEARLYMYNQAPLTPALSKTIPNRSAVRSFLGIDRGPSTALLNTLWEESGADAWIQWTSKHATESTVMHRAPMYKLYLSPTIEALPQVFETTVRILADAGVNAFKVGGSPRDLARPDKLVAYFRSRGRALECGELLSAALSGTTVQGVPFSAALHDDGLVSWGMDPADQLGRAPETSWRRWICRRLAHYLTAKSSASDGAVPPWEFALERLRLDGVDTARWEPDADRMNRETWAAS